jgi:hypothetical protein
VVYLKTLSDYTQSNDGAINEKLVGKDIVESLKRGFLELELNPKLPE